MRSASASSRTTRVAQSPKGLRKPLSRSGTNVQKILTTEAQRRSLGSRSWCCGPGSPTDGRVGGPLPNPFLLKNLGIISVSLPPCRIIRTNRERRPEQRTCRENGRLFQEIAGFGAQPLGVPGPDLEN